jgi:tRNA pseudouridine32 synthase/23S rRNA pseudouridine746 synthase
VTGNPDLTGTRILYQDDSLLAIDKPAGLLSLPDGYNPEKSYVASVLKAQFGRVWIVHRLDRDTSGVLLLARTAEAHRDLNLQFEGRKVTKVYHALVVGRPAWQSFEADLPLRTSSGHKHRTVIDFQNGKPAQTSFNCLELYRNHSLIEARPHSGYTHQIRAHLAWQGLPLIGDELYATRMPPELLYPPTIARVALHAVSIQITHPVTRQALSIEAPYPEDFSRTLEFLRQRA